jgi:2-oxoglutarate dehydrogenase E2 component (dihydrolipoamide succinyltransferase)
MSSIEILVPDLPESVADATVVNWLKKAGEHVQRDDILVEIETDKVVLEVPASADGVLIEVRQEEGATVVSRELLGLLDTSVTETAETKPVAKPADVAPEAPSTSASHGNDSLSPSVRRLLAEHSIEPNEIKGTGVGGRLTREDVDNYLSQQTQTSPTQPAVSQSKAPAAYTPSSNVSLSGREEKRVPMTRLRKRIAERLLDAKNNTAMLTTFNEVNMKPIMELRKKYAENLEQRHGVRLGFMSFYVKAVVEALKHYPMVNAAIDDDHIVYYNYFDISIAVSTDRGLVTPVLRNANTMSMAEIEKTIKGFAVKGKEGKLGIEDLSGGNFTITNGGVFGSLLSTPIINPPQSAILGMHAIKERPMAVNGQVEILPMMYLALSYDHRQIDGKDSVGFLVMIKELLEDPIRLVIEV